MAVVRARMQQGFTYVAMLIGVAIIGVGLAATGEVWSQSSQREKERELLFIGNEFRQAIERYARESTGAARYPAKLQDLLEDSRSVTVKRYLRRIYRDPMTGKAEWGLVMAPGGGIMGVHSLSTQAPLKTGNFRKADERFKNAQRYSDWLFLHEGAALPDGAAGGSPSPSGAPSSGGAPPPGMTSAK